MRHLLRRIGFYLVALWVALTLNFLIPRLMPGDPVGLYIARLQGRVDPRAIQSLRLQFGVTNDSLWTQYVRYLGQLLHADLGRSINYYPTPVTEIIGQSLPWTLVLVGLTSIISFSLGTLLGAISAWRRGSRLDRTLAPLLTFMSAVPYFWLALILLYVLGFTLKLFPLSGGYDLSLDPGFTPDFLFNAAYHAILPAFTIVASSIAGWVLGMRNAMLNTLAEDYVLMAEAKGLSDRRVMLMYAARNAILPNVTGFAIALGFVVSGALLTEIVFSYPGIGYYLLQAVLASDYPLMQGIFLVIAFAVLGSNFLADILYVLLDPRIRHER
jgi:peptide/nickel transport system permease protein